MANTTKNITIEDFESICRVCLKSSDNFVLISEFEIISMMSVCTSVQIWLNDDLPNHLCNTCFIDLKNAFNFKKLSENSDRILRQIVHKHNLSDKLVDKTDTDSLNKTNFNDSVKCEFEPDCKTKIKDEFEDTKIIKDDTNKKKIYRKQYTCEKCNLKFPYLRRLRLHIKRKHNPKKCNICKKTFKTPSKLRCHSVVHRNERPYQCPQCGKTFKLDAALKAHINLIHLAKDDRAPCDICGKHILKRYIQRHLITHNVRDPIQCDKCEKTFLYQNSLKMHIKRDHEKIENILKCDKCDMKYKSRSGFTHHIQTAHLNIKPHACTVCGQHFALKSTLASHMHTHTGERPFQCIFCEKSYSQKSSLRTHVKHIHANRMYVNNYNAELV